MNIPTTTVELTAEDQQRIRAAHGDFVRMMHTLTPKQQLARANRLANTAPGFARDQVDPYVGSLARQMVEAARANGRMGVAQAELKQIEEADWSSYRPKDPDHKVRMMARKTELEQHIQQDMVRLIQLAEEDHSRAKQESTKLYRVASQRQGKAQRLLDAVKRIEAEQEQSAIDAQAETIVRRRRTGPSDGGITRPAGE